MNDILDKNELIGEYMMLLCNNELSSALRRIEIENAIISSFPNSFETVMFKKVKNLNYRIDDLQDELKDTKRFYERELGNDEDDCCYDNEYEDELEE